MKYARVLMCELRGDRDRTRPFSSPPISDLELRFVQPRIDPASRQESLMQTFFNDPTTVHHHDPVDVMQESRVGGQ